MARPPAGGKALHKALEWLGGCVAGARARADLRLPNVKTLASQAGVSPKTMWKALRALGGRGVLTVIPGGGTFVAPGKGEQLDRRLFDLPVRDRPERVPRSEQVRRAISEDLLTGRHAPGAMLPPYKELQQIYGACYMTLRTALSSLASERRIEPHGKGFRVRQYAVYRGRPVIAHIYSRFLGEARGMVHATPFSAQYWHEIEKLRVQHGIEIELVHHDAALGHGPTAEISPRLAERYRDRSLLGCMIATLGLEEGWLDVGLQEIISHRWRTSILCEGWDPEVSPAVLHNPLLRFFALAGGSLAGEIVAEHLLQLGHRTVAVINPHREAHFATQRIAGLRRAFGRASGHRVVAVDADSDAEQDAWRRQPINRTFHRQANRYIRSTTPRYEHDGGVFTREIDLHMGQQFLKQHLVPHFENLLQDSSITAWVCVTDVVGLIALPFLRGMGVRVPEQVSVISFDNTVDSFGQGLTSYDFNVPAIASAMVGHIIESRGRGDHPEAVLEIPGTVMSRASTGPARP